MLGETLHTPTACSTCVGCPGSASKALGYNLLLAASREEEVVPQPKLGALALLSSQPLLPICSHSQLCPVHRGAAGGQDKEGPG